VCVCLCLCARTRACLLESHINLESANLEWDFHDKRVNKVNKLIKIRCKEMCEKETAQHSQNPASTEKFLHYNINNCLTVQLLPFPIIQETKTFRYMLRVTTVSAQNTTKNSPNA